MPLYEYRCVKCSKLRSTVRTVERRDELVMCDCGYRCKRVLAAPGLVKGPTPKFCTRECKNG